MKSIIQWIEPKKSLPADRQHFTNAALKTMIIPLVLEQLLQMVVGLADTMMVSYAGEAVVAGVGLDTMVYTIFIYLFTAISSGSQPSGNSASTRWLSELPQSVFMPASCKPFSSALVFFNTCSQ